MVDPDGILIEPVPAAARERALAFLADDGATPSASSEDITDMLFWAQASDEPLAVGRIQSRDGRLLHLLLPRLEPAAPRTVGFELLKVMIAAARRIQGAHFAQTLVPVEDAKWQDALHDLQLESIATVLVMASLPELPASDSPLQFLPLVDSERAHFGDVVQQTWADSLDCVDLEDTRPIEAVLADYERRCLGDLRHWYLVRDLTDEVGCLLLDAPEEASPLEIVYWGVLPGFRGRGLGQQILHFAREIGSRQRSMITAVVDSENWPAINAYNQAGFSTVDHQKLFIMQL